MPDRIAQQVAQRQAHEGAVHQRRARRRLAPDGDARALVVRQLGQRDGDDGVDVGLLLGHRRRGDEQRRHRQRVVDVLLHLGEHALRAHQARRGALVATLAGEHCGGALDRRRGVVQRLAHLVREQIEHLAPFAGQARQLGRLALELGARRLLAPQLRGAVEQRRHVLGDGERAHRAAGLVVLHDGRQQHVHHRAVAALHLQRQAVLAPAAPQPRQVLGEHRVARAGRQEVDRRAAQHLVPLPAERRQPAVGNRDEATFGVDAVQHRRCLLVQQALGLVAAHERGAALEQRPLGGQAVGDVLVGADVAGDRAVVGAQRAAAADDLAHRAVRAHEADGHFELAARRGRLAPVAEHGLAVVGVHAGAPAVAQALLEGQAGDFLPALVGIDVARPRVGLVDAHRQRIGQGAELRFAGGQLARRLAHLVFLGDVGGQHDEAVDAAVGQPARQALDPAVTPAALAQPLRLDLDRLAAHGRLDVRHERLQAVGAEDLGGRGADQRLARAALQGRASQVGPDAVQRRIPERDGRVQRVENLRRVGEERAQRLGVRRTGFGRRRCIAWTFGHRTRPRCPRALSRRS